MDDMNDMNDMNGIMNDMEEDSDRYLVEVEELRRAISCGICLEVFDNPVSIDVCSHYACKKCIMQVIHQAEANEGKGKGKGKGIRCPFCKASFTRNNIVETHMLQDLINSIADLTTSLDPYPSLSRSPITFLQCNIARQPTVINTNTVDDAVSTFTTPCRRPTSIVNNNNNNSDNSDINNNDNNNDNDNDDKAKAKESITFRPGDTVIVLPRTWPGINKLGGAAYITARNDDENTYDVKYILSNTKDKNVPAAYIQAEREEGPRSRKQISPSIVTCTKRKPLSELTSEQNNEKRSKSTPTSSSKKLVLLLTHTANTEDARNDIKEFNETFTADSADSFQSNVTHLIVNLDKDKVMKHRTMKYMQGLMAGLWVVSADWVTDSLKERRLLPETNYEVRKNVKALLDDAPRRAREAYQKKLKLFSRYCVLLFGGFPNPGPSKVNVSSLLHSGGAQVLNSIQDMIAFSQENSKHILVAIAAEESYQDKLKTEIDLHNNSRQKGHEEIQMVTLSWVLDSVTNFKALDLAEYHFT